MTDSGNKTQPPKRHLKVWAGELTKDDTIHYLNELPRDHPQGCPYWRNQYFKLFQLNYQSILLYYDENHQLDSIFKFRKWLKHKYGAKVGIGWFAYCYFSHGKVWETFQYHDKSYSDIVIEFKVKGKQTSISGQGKYGSSHIASLQGKSNRYAPTPSNR